MAISKFAGSAGSHAGRPGDVTSDVPIVRILDGQRVDQVANVRADAEVANAADVDDDAKRRHLESRSPAMASGITRRYTRTALELPTVERKSIGERRDAAPDCGDCLFRANVAQHLGDQRAPSRASPARENRAW